MLVPWIALIIELLCYFMFKPFIENDELFAVVILIINIPFILFVIFKFVKPTSSILFFSFFIRLFFMFWDIYGRKYFLLPHSGNDSEGFLFSAIRISKDLSLLNESIYGGLYAKILGIVFYLGPVNRLVGQYINVMLGITTIILVYKIMRSLEVRKKNRVLILLFVGTFPSAIIFSSILLREALISFLVILSFNFFLKWYKNNNIFNVLIAIMILILGATLHSGVIGILLGYIFLFLFYNHFNKRLIFNVKSVILFLFLIFVTIAISIYPMENIPFLNKFTQYMDSTDDVYQIASNSRGGAEYLTGLQIDSPIELLLYSPVKMLYFLGSPLPWDWRGIYDIATFILDGLLYLVLILYPLSRYRSKLVKNPLLIGILIMLFSFVFIFGIGISNAGTAMRHRHKIFYLSIIFFALITQKSRKLLSNKIKVD